GVWRISGLAKTGKQRSLGSVYCRSKSCIISAFPKETLMPRPLLLASITMLLGLSTQPLLADSGTQLTAFQPAGETTPPPGPPEPAAKPDAPPTAPAVPAPPAASSVPAVPVPPPGVIV